MERLFAKLCMPQSHGPSMNIDEAKKLNFNDLLIQSLKSSSYIASEPDFRKELTREFKATLSTKSSSASNTLRTVDQMFDAAAQVCGHSSDRDLINWLHTCVSLAVKQGLDENVGGTHKPKSTSGSGSAIKRKSQKSDSFVVPDDKVDELEHQQLGASDDDYDPASGDEDDDEYVPTDEDAVVPDVKLPKTRLSPKSSPRKKSASPSGKRKSSAKDDGLNPSKSTNEVFPSKADSGRAEKQQQMQEYHNQSFPKSTFAQPYFFPSKDSYSAFLSALNSSKSTLDICVFSITDDDTADALIAAHKRGVKIRIITDDQQAAIKGADAGRLQKDYGIPYKTDHTQGYMHNKFAIIDHKLMVSGSFNWSKGARFKNKENIIITNMPNLVKGFDGEFQRLWGAF
ncbi:hypothetical protein INT43_006483 [Umbelopsis isabellina]|uniref:Mitochondrial cardiolipin hydrolase n=1 Tax=Mortierella isabellina TaxID=91625 RepID=A0A8H7PZU0_MORIS|nr:hypothetical protein INT43_006483 [Umbelopsis isabellina]